MPKDDAYPRARRLLELTTVLLEQPERRWRTKELAERLGVSPDTAYRDIQELSRTGIVPLGSSGTTADFVWYVIPESRATLPPLRLDFAEGASFYAAARLLSQQQDERNDAVRSALRALVAVLPEPLRPHLDGIVMRLGKGTSRDNISEIFDRLSQGWLARRIVKLAYEPPRTGVFSCRFAPYLLEPSGIGRTIYFIGRSEPPGALRTFKLERVRNAELTEDTFEVPEDFDGVELLGRAWGVMYGEGEPVRIKLRFNASVSKRVRETTWHGSQQSTETPEGLEQFARSRGRHGICR
jgi:predicted DNA-binding transcriptional regulator YafY